MVKVTYRITITTPANQAGTKGETKEVEDRAARQLLAGGYVVLAKKEKSKDATDERTNPQSKRPAN